MLHDELFLKVYPNEILVSISIVQAIFLKVVFDSDDCFDSLDRNRAEFPLAAQRNGANFFSFRHH